jgi:hypothetical protein
MWTRSDNNADVNLDQAVDYCKNLKSGGYSDWRLPEIEELKGISDPSENVPVNRPDLVALHIPGYPAQLILRATYGYPVSKSVIPGSLLQTYRPSTLDLGR